jgi:hypothetical protein
MSLQSCPGLQAESSPFLTFILSAPTALENRHIFNRAAARKRRSSKYICDHSLPSFVSYSGRNEI